MRKRFAIPIAVLCVIAGVMLNPWFGFGQDPCPSPTPTDTPTATATATPAPAWAWDAQAATVDPDSDALIAAFKSYAVDDPIKLGKPPNVALSRWAVATADAGPGDPTYSIPRSQQGGSITVRVKLGTQPDPAGDGHLTVRDADLGVETDFWQAKYNATTQRITSTSAAVSFPLGSVNEKTTGWGGNAANTPLRRGLVTAEQILAGSIDETLQFGIPKIGTGAPRFPALHNAPTCGTDCANHLVEGTWVRLDPTYDVAGSGLPAWQKTVALDMQAKGMILRDNSGSLVVYGRNPINGGAAWSSAGFTSSSVAFSTSFPWGRLQVLNPPSPPTN